ncbi:MAG TPA: DUF2846 domain-containing protein, partial [Nitrosospira sp.]
MKTSRSLMSVLLAVISIMTITGCETFGPKYATVRNDTAVLPEEKGRIVFYRPSSHYGYGMRPDILLNGKKVGTSRPGTIFFVDVDPGKWQVTVPAVLYPGKTSIDISIPQHETVYVKTSFGPSAFAGRTDIEVVNSEKAMTE